MYTLVPSRPGVPHRWVEAISAWAAGCVVQWRYESSEATDADWRDCDYPSRGMPNWEHPGIEYRVPFDGPPASFATLDKFAALAAPGAAEQPAPQAPEVGVEPVAELERKVWNVLMHYANECTYEAPRVGGVLDGCPRGVPPTPQELTADARWMLADLARAQGRDPEPWTAYDQPRITDSERLKFLHTLGSGNPDKDGYEWGVFRVKWDASGKQTECWQTFSDSSDLDAVITEAKERNDASK